MGVFYDAGCSAIAPSKLYATRNYGASLPFSNEAIVSTNECMSCKQVDQDNNNNNNNNQNYNNGNGYYYEEEYETTELCEMAYETAVKCESNMKINYKDTSGCDYINTILPRLSSASRSSGIYGGKVGSSGNAGSAFAWIFACTTILFGAYAYFLYRKIKRGSAQMSAGNGNLA
jgi:cbb3-type cytochrome oxidase subunit 3